jgi:hypothetical protein
MRIRDMIITLEQLMAEHGDKECVASVGQDATDVEVVEHIYDNTSGAYVIVIGDKHTKDTAWNS